MKHRVSLSCVGLLSLAASVGAAEPCVPTTGRSVTGSATLRVPPDRVSFTVGVETTAPSVFSVTVVFELK